MPSNAPRLNPTFRGKPFDGRQPRGEMLVSKFRTVTLPFTHRFDQSTPWEGQTGRIVPDLPTGPQNFWGIPFEFNEQSLLIIGDGGSVSPVDIAIDALASFVVVAHFCDSRARRTVAGLAGDADILRRRSSTGSP